jgi:hypothetical protein
MLRFAGRRAKELVDQSRASCTRLAQLGIRLFGGEEEVRSSTHCRRSAIRVEGGLEDASGEVTPETREPLAEE